MSVTSESRENNKIVIIESFTGCRDGIEFSWEEARHFEIGEFVYYLDGFKDPDTLFS